MMNPLATSSIERRVRELGPWFHDLELAGVRTAPEHPLGNFLHDLWTIVEPHLPGDMTGMTALDIGCNAGFYSLQMWSRGARVTGIEHDPRYLEQARFAADVLGADVQYVQMDVYDIESLGRHFDYVLFMGVLYHLRHPLYALEKVARVVGDRLIFQSMLRGGRELPRIMGDYPITEREIFLEPDFPAMYFIENSYAGDPTNWWIPNRAAMEAMLRSAGLRIDAAAGDEVYVCSPTRRGASVVTPA